MSEKVVDLADYRRKKQSSVDSLNSIRQQDASDFDSYMRNSYNVWVLIMKERVEGIAEYKTEEVTLWCEEYDEFVLVDVEGYEIPFEDGELFDEPYPDDYEIEDLVINSLIELAPRKVIVRDSHLGDPYFITALGQVFGSLVVVEF